MIRLSSALLLAFAANQVVAFAPSQTAQWTQLATTVPSARGVSTVVDSAPSAMKVNALYMTAAVSEEGDAGEEEAADTLPPGDASVTQLCFNLVKGKSQISLHLETPASL